MKLHLAANQALTLEVAAQVASPAAWPVAWPGRQDVVWELSPPPVPSRDQRQPTVSLEKDQIVEIHKIFTCIFTGYSPVTGAGSCAYQHYHIVIQNSTFVTNEENNGKRVILGVLVSKPSHSSVTL